MAVDPPMSAAFTWTGTRVDWGRLNTATSPQKWKAASAKLPVGRIAAGRAREFKRPSVDRFESRTLAPQAVDKTGTEACPTKFVVCRAKSLGS